MIQIISENAEDILLRFHQHLVQRKRLSDAKTGAYISVARDFASWYESWTGGSFQVWPISMSAVHPYREHLIERGLPPKVIRQQLLILRALLDWSVTHFASITRVS